MKARRFNNADRSACNHSTMDVDYLPPHVWDRRDVVLQYKHLPAGA